MLVNNEVGTIQPLADVAALVSERAPHAVLHTDAVQAVPWLDVAAATAGCDLIAISGHKFGGPKGVGVLVVRNGVTLIPEIEGGGQERGLRAGTVNVAGAVALATALRITHERRAEETARVIKLRERLMTGLLDVIPSVFVNGDPDHKIVGNCHLGFPGLEVRSAPRRCSTTRASARPRDRRARQAHPSPRTCSRRWVCPGPDALASIRLSLGYASTVSDVNTAVDVIPGLVAQLRGMAAA